MKKYPRKTQHLNAAQRKNNTNVKTRVNCFEQKHCNYRCSKNVDPDKVLNVLSRGDTRPRARDSVVLETKLRK